MKFKLSRTTNPHKTKKIEINSLEELMALVKKEKEPIIVMDDPPRLEIYDDYRE